MALKDEDLRPLYAPLHAEDFGLTSTHLSEHAPVRVRLVVESGSMRVVLRKLDAGGELDELLEAVRDVADEVVLGESARALLGEVDRRRATLKLTDWLATHGAKWAEERRHGLVVAIEVASRLDAREADRIIAIVLRDDHADPLTRRIAAHRARHVTFRDDELRRHAWEGVRRWVEAWIDRDPEQTAPVVPSAAVGGLPALDWLLGLVEHSNEQIARAAATGLLDLLAGSTRPRVTIDAADRERVVHAACRARAGAPGRVERNATLVWLLGAAATPTTMEEVAVAVRDAFQSGGGDEPVAAVQAARMLVLGSSNDMATQCLHRAFETAPGDADRFWRLVNQLRPSWPS